ncbi:HPr(Ser) kinase/phosphatase [Bacillus cereus]|uniref:HPr(Ser) kinase/phosphatase n=1 Tax=Bacillus cereus TaxID=1396 RepID=UPI000BFCE1A1|nr:HPr(Ser) kinase/phosphatase [Bacillus cereus]PGP11599.1 HPr(Ser) kinase/phosphatase [Bacillus cereus]
MNKYVTVEQIMKFLKLKLVSGSEGLQKEITKTDFHRPGLQLVGFYDKFPRKKVQIIGNQETYYIQSLNEQERKVAIQRYIEAKPICIVVTNNHDTSYFEELCAQNNVPLFSTSDGSHEFGDKMVNFLEKSLAKEIGIHGVCMNVFGVGILIRGDSGVGKSEAALSLINKGHRLIADDLVILKKIGPHALIGTHNGYNKHFLALRGIGLVNIPKVYGSGSIQNETKINLEIKLSTWDDSKYYDAIQAEVHYVTYLDTKIKHIEIPIRPGRDIAELVEVAAKNWRLEQEGYFAYEDFQSRF